MASLVKSYLLMYNVFCCLGWAFVLGNFCLGLQIGDVWGATETGLKVIQTSAVLEIVHVALGLVRTGLFSTLVQVGSRIWLLWVVADSFDVVGDFLAFKTMVAAWSLSEVPRYLYYVIAQQQKPPYWLTWLRYSGFILLYPVGVASEMACMYGVLSLMKANPPYSIFLPNQLNFSFNTYFFSILALFGYLPGLPLLYSYMLAQRKKYLGSYGPDSAASVAAKKIN